ncbi:hypothetical protein PoB_002876400 [Plakobranchus ocellatus]|uniref:Uncharacterized protein n=1 Tax=Plakobranchus ocellatus TaxID=259542 RepID=A0AAV4A6T6_9GAST|nr:hypothetical protein PoB_002876400 [Plakobranchus ocellatus]
MQNQRKRRYGYRSRKDRTEVSCWIKYLMFGFNVMFWARHGGVGDTVDSESTLGTCRDPCVALAGFGRHLRPGLTEGLKASDHPVVDWRYTTTTATTTKQAEHMQGKQISLHTITLGAPVSSGGCDISLDLDLDLIDSLIMRGMTHDTSRNCHFD